MVDSQFQYRADVLIHKSKLEMVGGFCTQRRDMHHRAHGEYREEVCTAEIAENAEKTVLRGKAAMVNEDEVFKGNNPEERGALVLGKRDR